MTMLRVMSRVSQIPHPTDNGDLDLLGTFMAHLDEPKEDITMERTQESVTQRGMSNCGSTSRTEQLI